MNEAEIWLCKMVMLLILILVSFFVGMYIGYIVEKPKKSNK